MHPSSGLSDGYYAGSLADQACLVAVQEYIADPTQRKELEQRLSATFDRAEQDRLKELLDEIVVTLQEGEVLDLAHMDALREIVGVAGLEVHVNIGRGRRVGRGVEGYCYYESE